MKHFVLLAFALVVATSLLGQNLPEQGAMLYVDSTGQVYTRADAPAYIFISPADKEGELIPVPSSDKAANPMEWDGPGKHYIVHKDLKRNMNVRFRIMADGKAPSSSLHLKKGLIFRYNNVLFAESGSLAKVSASDDMTGISKSFISVDSATYEVQTEPRVFSGNKEYNVKVYSIDNVGNIEEPKVFKVITTTQAAVKMDNIYFASNSSALTQASIIELNKLVAILKQFPHVHLEIGAHTDCNGEEDYNQRLSELRAEAVVTYLKAKGVSGDRLTAKGYGETMLINDCQAGVVCPESKHRENRRVEFIIVKVDENQPKTDK